MKQLSYPAEGEKEDFDWQYMWENKHLQIRGKRCKCSRTWFEPPDPPEEVSCKDQVRRFRHHTFTALLRLQMRDGLPDDILIENWKYDAWIGSGCKSWRVQGE